MSSLVDPFEHTKIITHNLRYVCTVKTSFQILHFLVCLFFNEIKLFTDSVYALLFVCLLILESWSIVKAWSKARHCFHNQNIILCHQNLNYSQVWLFKWNMNMKQNEQYISLLSHINLISTKKVGMLQNQNKTVQFVLVSEQHSFNQIHFS